MWSVNVLRFEADEYVSNFQTLLRRIHVSEPADVDSEETSQMNIDSYSPVLCSLLKKLRNFVFN
jgi:hypothetical protein